VTDKGIKPKAAFPGSGGGDASFAFLLKVRVQ
jgi:hypothetical protein